MKGRPQKKQPERRENVLRIRLTEAERAELDDIAQKKGLDSSSWARSELLQIARLSKPGHEKMV